MEMDLNGVDCVYYGQNAYGSIWCAVAWYLAVCKFVLLHIIELNARDSDDDDASEHIF